MSLFGWFKKKQKEAQTPDLPEIMPQSDVLEDELQNFQDSFTPKVTEEDLINEGFREVDKIPGEPAVKLKAILSNKTLTVFLPGGDVLVNTDADKKMFLAVRAAVTEIEVHAIMLDKTLVPEDKTLVDKVFDDEKIMEAMPEILDTKEFEYQDGSLYLKGINLAVPKLLAKEFIKAGERETSEYYDSLKSFWCWCALNPNATAREDLFGFLERGDFKITKNGFFLGFRNVEKVNSGKKKDDTLVKFITDKYMNIKLKQKKSPKNYEVYWEKDNTLTILSHGKDVSSYDSTNYVGNLGELYNSLSDMKENVYTDQRTKTMKIVIGKAVSMERDECDSDPYSPCSRGLHCGNKAFGYQSFGNTTILVAINPMNVVAVPKRDVNKMRVCEYFPLAVIEGDKNYLEDADTLSLEDEYMTDEIKLLQGTIDSSNSLNTQVFNKLSEYQKVVNQRVVEIK